MPREEYAMPMPLRLLILEDRPADVELMLHALHQADFAPTWQRVATEADYVASLHPDIEVILADYTLPQFDALRALHLLQAHDLDIPFIVVTGNLSEEVAVECMKQGAADYVLRESLRRLGPAVTRALRDKTLREEKRRTEVALRDSEARYRELFENANDLLYVHDLHGRIISINHAAQRLSGYSHAEALTMNIFDVVAPEYRARARQMMLQKMTSDGPTTYELELVTKSGRRVALEVSSRLIYQDDVPSCVQGIARDITERKQLEAQLRRAQRMEALGTLAGGIAHDFNNILAAILGYTELGLYDVPRGTRVWHNLQEVLTAGRRAKELVQQILMFSRQTEQGRRPVHLDMIVKEVLRLLRASLPSTIVIEQEISLEPMTVLADPTQMHQVLMNLCANAEYAMRASGGTLAVHLQPVTVDGAFAAAHPMLAAGPGVRLTIRDTGSGMPPEVAERIFEPFFTTKGVGEGTGMGLAVVHGIVTSHDGTITVTSVPGAGTTFDIYLPRTAELPPESPQQEAQTLYGHERILFVDDEASLARLGQEMLERLGYTVIVRTSSVEALEAFRAMPERFDLVITDQTMPNMTGEKLARELRRIRPNIPIILCTGFSHVMTPEKARALSIDAYLLKPLVTHDLGATIRRVVEQYRSQENR
jgi:PAS domain S-box-containing protein